jgi:uncharacterized protein
MAALNYYIYLRFFSRLHSGFNRYAAVIPLLLMLGNIFFVVDIATNIIPDSPSLYLITSSFVGITFVLFFIAVFYDLSITASSKVPFDKERRKTLKLLFDITMIIAAFSYLLRGLSQGLKYPQVNTVKIKINNFKLDNFKIVQLSDVHVGRTIKHDYVKNLVTQINDLSADIIVITGDLIDHSLNKIKHDLEPLSQLNAPCYFILGNHEYFHDPEESIKYIKSLGIQPLLNECIIIEKNNQRFNLIGVNDFIGENIGIYPADFKQAYANADLSLATIVLAHQPKMIETIGDYPCDLMLSGHTHGGQIFPFGLLVMIAQPYLAGLHQHSASKQIFISRGTGYWGPPIRILSPSEISQLIVSSK